MVTRIGLMLPGAVALGAYEGGAMAALLTAVQHSDQQLVIDSIASASAGSMTALVAARSLLTGADPVDLMLRTWVALPDMRSMRTHDPAAPLTMKHLIERAKQLLGTSLVPGTELRQTGPVRLSMAFTVLGGLTYRMSQLLDPTAPRSEAQTLYATTYLDFYNTTLSGESDFSSVLDAAMTSGANPLGFPPRKMDRGDVAEQYRKNGVIVPPNAKLDFWCSDGGDVDNQPLGRLLNLIDQTVASPDEDQRVIVMLNIMPSATPSFEGTWFDMAEQPTWLDTMLHVDRIRSTQSLFDDLRTLEKTNRRIAWTRHVAEQLAGSVDAATLRPVADEVATWRDQVRAQVRGADRSDGAADNGPGEPIDDLEALLLEAAGLRGKQPIKVEVISPVDDSNVPVTRQLSGEFLFHFGGFFDARLRQNDFALGYADAEDWLRRWLPGRVEDPQRLLDHVSQAARFPAYELPAKEASLSELSASEKLEALGLLAHIGEVVVADLALEAIRRSRLLGFIDRLLGYLRLQRIPRRARLSGPLGDGAGSPAAVSVE